ncbi:MAG: FAD-binding oxidoreductase [Candidatus Schekmanbacteria bacterium]|nr:FAD-binding oxidoreductase [Candidatus Schekmanbacteria bacterium]
MPLISRRIAEGIVQPCDEPELIWLLKFADQHKIPLTPRGKGTSGYGGAVPRYGGLVVDFTRMNKLLSIDAAKCTVTVEPGMVWLDLEAKLADYGLSLRLYPGSAPSSTVAGWLAQGGSGFGSYSYGWFGDNVVSARVVLPDGEAVSYTADALDLVKDAGGLTGFISAITIKVKPAGKMHILTAALKTESQLSGLLNAIVQKGLDLWSVSFVNPYREQLQNKLREPPTPAADSYLIIFVYPDGKTATTSELEALVGTYHGRVLEPEFSERLWQERFHSLQIKKLAPSLISTKVAIPLASLETALGNCRKLKPSLAIEGVILREKTGLFQAVLLGFILHDERKVSYNLVYSLSLSFIKLAEKIGGRPCSIGIYFKYQAAKILGESRLQRIIGHKQQTDPHNILNPGKIIGQDMLYYLMTLTWKAEPIVRWLANRVPRRDSEFSNIPFLDRDNHPHPVPPPSRGRGINSLPPCGGGLGWGDRLISSKSLRNTRSEPAGNGTKVPAPKNSRKTWNAFCCDQCGFCLKGCPQFQGWESRSPKGYWYLQRLLIQNRYNPSEINLPPLSCLNCNRCLTICPQALLPYPC